MVLPPWSLTVRDELQRKAFFKSQAKNPHYLRQGDVVTATIATPDGRIELGEQRTHVTDAN